MTLTDYISGLTVTQGAGAGERIRVLPWQRRFLRGAFTVEGDAALSIARGNGKSTLVAAIACAVVDGPLRQPRAEVVCVASSFAQGRIIFEHVRAFLEATGRDLGDRSTWRVQDSANVATVEHRPTGARVRCIGSDPKRAHGLAPLLVLADEPSQWEASKRDAMRAALATAMGKIDDSRMIALGTRPADPSHWFSKMLDGGADFAQCHAAGESDPPFRVRTWRKANPSLPAMPALEKRIRREAQDARRDPAMLASFRALRLNQGTDDVLRAMLIDVAVWRRAERAEPVDMAGRYALGLDLGQSAAMSAAAAYWPETGRLDVFAVFPELPDVRERGLADGVGNLYVRMVERGELLLAGRHVADVRALLGEVLERWGRPAVIACDRWREGDLREALDAIGFPLAELAIRGQGFRDGGEDVRTFRKAMIGGTVAPTRSLLLRAAIGEARAIGDPAGNWKLAKKTEGGRRAEARDDAAAAAILAVAEGHRRGAAAPRRRRMRSAIVG
ncbi:MAG: terminase large subunit [Thiotrichales bacterium]|nr:terminase large subunit [Thiotrichales bacterium]